MDTQIDNNQQPIVEQQSTDEQQLSEEERKAKLKTNKKIVLDEEPVLFNIPYATDDTIPDIPLNTGASVTLSSEPTPVENDLPQEQSGNITF